MKRRNLLWAAAAVSAALLALAWAFAPRPVEVETATAALTPFETTIDEDARTRLRERYVVSAPLAGRLGRIALHAGDDVAEGAPVASLQPALAPMLDERTQRELAARVDTALARVKLAAAQSGRTDVALRQAQADLGRAEPLAAQGYVSATQRDNARLALQAAQKDDEAAQQERRVADASLAEARAALAAVRHPGAAGAAFVVRSPVAGRVLKVLQESEGMVALGTPLLELGDLAQLEVVAELLSTDALAAPPGAPVRIERWGGSGTLEGRVRRVEPAAFTKVSALGVEEQRVKVLIELASPAERWRALGDGYRVGVRVVTRSMPQALTVPVGAVFPRSDAPGMAVFALRDGRARLTPVEAGARNGQLAWIRAGLQAGDTVIVYPGDRVRDGERVRERRA